MKRQMISKNDQLLMGSSELKCRHTTVSGGLLVERDREKKQADVRSEWQFSLSGAAARGLADAPRLPEELSEGEAARG